MHHLSRVTFVNNQMRSFTSNTLHLRLIRGIFLGNQSQGQSHQCRRYRCQSDPYNNLQMPHKALGLSLKHTHRHTKTSHAYAADVKYYVEQLPTRTITTNYDRCSVHDLSFVYYIDSHYIYCLHGYSLKIIYLSRTHCTITIQQK